MLFEFFPEALHVAAEVVHGFGNNGTDGTEGIIFKNTIGTYLHGPILSKNPRLADYLIAKSIEIKYGAKPELAVLPDDIELSAKKTILDRYLKRSSR